MIYKLDYPKLLMDYKDYY